MTTTRFWMSALIWFWSKCKRHISIFVSSIPSFMKRILPASLIVILFYNMMGFYLNYTLEQHSIRHAIKHRLKENIPISQLTLITISERNCKQIRWVEKNKEFWYDGNMYDVVKIKKKINATCYYCINDTREKKLMVNLDKLVREQTSDSRSTTIQKKPVNDYLLPIGVSLFFNMTIIRYCEYSPALQSIDKEILTPPPRPLSCPTIFS